MYAASKVSLTAYHVPDAIAVAVMYTCGLSGWSRRMSSRHRMIAEAASVMGHTSYSLRGSATFADFMTSSTVHSKRRWAYGLRAP